MLKHANIFPSLHHYFRQVAIFVEIFFHNLRQVVIYMEVLHFVKKKNHIYFSACGKSVVTFPQILHRYRDISNIANVSYFAFLFFFSNFYVNQNHAYQSKNMQHVQTIFRICNLKETSIDRIFKQLLSRNCVQQTVKYVTKTSVVNKLKLLVYLSFFET